MLRMTRWSGILLALLAVQAGLRPDDVLASTAQNPLALAARERAEQAIADERWCDAAHEFLRAYDMSTPTVREALLNAAVAARRGNDREFAASLYERFVAAHPVHRHRATAERLAGELRVEIEREGPGSACPPAPPLPVSRPGGIVVRADAPGAVVFADDMVVGEAPLTVQPSSMDSVLLRVEAPGRIPFVTQVMPTLEEILVEARLPAAVETALSPPADERSAIVVEDSPSVETNPVAVDTLAPTREPDQAGVMVVIGEPPQPPDVVSFEPPPPRGQPARRTGRLGTYGWALVGSGAVFAGGGGGFTWSATQAAQELSSYVPSSGDLPNREFDAELQGLEQRYETHRMLGGGGMMAGGLLAGVGLILVLIDGVM